MRRYALARHGKVNIFKGMSVLTTLDSRTREIFRQIVESYLETGEPVGSRTLSQTGGLQVSAATIRNTMADLTDMGLLHAPHISAGRLPTEQGLRMFVDGLMEIGDLTPEERSALEQQAGPGARADEVLGQLAGRLSGLTRTAGLVLTGKSDSALKHIEFVKTAPDKALVVLVHDNGDVENRVINLPAGLPPTALEQAGNYLNRRLQGRSLGEARRMVLEEVEAKRAALDELTSELVRQGVAEMGGGDGLNLIVRGQANLLSGETLDDIDRVRMLFEDLERQQDVIELVRAAQEGEGVRIFIGSENRLFSLSGSSVIVAPYRDREQKIVGVLGVIGPTRLNYSRIIPMVDYTAELVTRLIR